MTRITRIGKNKMRFVRVESGQRAEWLAPAIIGRLRFRMSLLLSILIACSLVTIPIQQAQSPAPATAPATNGDKAQLHQALLDLTNSWTVLCVAAHPDDEDGSTLTVLRRKYGVHTVSLFSTYGEGGQNAVGPELYEELGVIRARETMAAAQVQGSEPHFLGLRDFGFSKSAEETFRAWGEKEALRRMVLQIRQLRPDVIITNHDTTSGHGHHQATGRLILQAFDAAADPKQFPEQLNEVKPWQAQRLFVRAFRGPNTDTSSPPKPEAPLQVVSVDPNERDPIRGTTYAQQALAALRQHATQGPWPKTVSPNGARVIRYNLVRQVQTAGALPPDAKTVFDGLHLPELVSSSLIAPTIDNKPLTEFVDQRGEVLVSLITTRKRGAFTASKEAVESDPQRFQLMSRRLDNALAVVTETSLTLNTKESVLVPGQEAQFIASLTNSGDAEIQIKRLTFRGLGMDRPVDAAEKLLPGTETSGKVQFTTPKTMSITVPSSEHLYDGHLFGDPFVIKAELAIEGASFSMTTAVQKDVAPAVEIVSVEPSSYVRTPATSQQPLNFKVRLQNHLPNQFRGLVRVVGQSLETGREIVIESGSTDVANVAVRTSLPMTQRTQAKSSLVISVDLPIPKEPIARKSVPLIYVDALVARELRVGFLPSFDETLARALASLGVDAKKLSVDDIAKGDLSTFDTIIIDNRGYEAHPGLVGVNDRLLKFAEDGGTLVVFYHKTNEWNPDANRNRPQLAPYPIILSDDRVTEEDAPVTFLQPRDPLMNFPNRITQADFANWIQERGLYFPKEWDAHYAALLATNDKGEPLLRGGLLVARYGKGNYIYTSMVWYRQLRAGIPGGYRFFANLISYGKRNIRR